MQRLLDVAGPGAGGDALSFPGRVIFGKRVARITTTRGGGGCAQGAEHIHRGIAIARRHF